MITIVNGDLFHARDGVICHQVNCKGVMGRGVAKTFKEYVNACRIKQSKEYLTSSDLSINDISAKVGFETVQSFNRVFLKKTGNTPSGYRKLYKMKQL